MYNNMKEEEEIERLEERIAELRAKIAQRPISGPGFVVYPKPPSPWSIFKDE